MEWKTFVQNVEAQTGELLINTKGYIELKHQRLIETNIKDYKHGEKTIYKFWERSTQQLIDFGETFTGRETNYRDISDRRNAIFNYKER